MVYYIMIREKMKNLDIEKSYISKALIQYTKTNNETATKEIEVEIPPYIIDSCILNDIEELVEHIRIEAIQQGCCGAVVCEILDIYEIKNNKEKNNKKQYPNEEAKKEIDKAKNNIE